jgi:hypothetical protein
MTMLAWLQEQRAPCLFLGWLRESGMQTPAEAVTACPRGDLLLWVAHRIGYSPEEIYAAARPARLRAVREHAAAAMAAARLLECAVVLRALPDDVSMPVAARAAVDAGFAADAERYRSDAVMAAQRAASCAYSAWMGSAVASVGWAASAAEWAAWPKGEAAKLAAWEAEHARCAAEVRAALPNLASRWSAAMEVEL